MLGAAESEDSQLIMLELTQTVRPPYLKSRTEGQKNGRVVVAIMVHCSQDRVN